MVPYGTRNRKSCLVVSWDKFFLLFENLKAEVCHPTVTEYIVSQRCGTVKYRTCIITNSKESLELLPVSYGIIR